MAGKPIIDGPDRYALRVEPNGVYLTDGRMIPSRNNTAARIDDGQFVVGVHRPQDLREGVLGRVIGVNVEQ